MPMSMYTLNVILGYLFVAIKMWAFVDAATQKKPYYEAVGRQSKLFWVGLLGISVFSQYLSVNSSAFKASSYLLAIRSLVTSFIDISSPLLNT